MGLKTFVKISNVSNLSDARYCAGMMVDILGFNIDPNSSSCIKDEDFQEITNWVAGVQLAGEFHGASTDQIERALETYPIDYVETSEIEILDRIKLAGKSIIFRMKIDEDQDIINLPSRLDYLNDIAAMVLIQSDHKELFEKLDAQLLSYTGNLKLLKSYGISVHSSMEKFPGLALEATEEDRPGYKDYGEIMDILELIETD